MNEKLIGLINRSSFQNLFGSQNFEDYKIMNVGLMPKESVYRTFERRSRLNNNITSKLLDEIKSFSGSTIQLTNLQYLNNSYLVFTDREFVQLIGVITFEE